MNTRPRIVATTLALARAGDAFTVPSPGGTVGPSTPPGSTDACWIDIGKVEDFELNPQTDDKDVMGGAPGRRVRIDVLRGGTKIDFKWTCLEYGPLNVETLLATVPLGSGSTQFNPGAGGIKKFWALVQHYDDQNLLVHSELAWGALSAEPVTFGEDQVKPVLNFKVIHSPFNTGGM